MRERLLKQAQREYSPGKRMLAFIPLGILFLGLLPAAIVLGSEWLDRQLGFPRLAFGPVHGTIGFVLFLAGIAFAWWSIYVQFTVGRGTPLPVMATQSLITQKPYQYCRNPMALGTIVAYSGVAVLAGSISALAIVLLGATLLLLYIKFLEEKEMEARFGQAYREYRKQTPFLLPRLWRRK